MRKIYSNFSNSPLRSLFSEAKANSLMYVSYRTLCDSPAPTTAVCCRFPFSSTPCIAAASETKLQIFTYRDDQLLLIWEKNYWAKIISIFKHNDGKFDSLILVCDVSKIVVLKCVAGVDFEETEFHSFETYETTSHCVKKPTIAVIDPNDTCIALLIGGLTLYFLTLNQRNSFDLNKRPTINDGEHSKWETITGAVCFHLTSDFKPPIYRVHDMKFLEGYNRPTIAIMHELIPTWSVRLPNHKSTIAVSIVSPLLIEREGLDIKDQSASWTSRPLPHNSMVIAPILVPFGGFLVLSKNAIIYMTHTSGLAYGLNQLAYDDDECPFELCDRASKPYEIFSPIYAVMDETHVLLSLDQHKLGILTLHTNGVDVTGMSLFVQDDFEFHPSLYLKYRDDIYFGGSIIQDSILFNLKYQCVTQEQSFIESISLNESQLELYRSLYESDPINPPKKLITSIDINILATIYQIGTVSCATPFINVRDNAYLQGHEDAISMALGCGLNKSGCLQYLRLGLTPQYLHEVNFSEVVNTYFSQRYKILLFSRNSKTDSATFVFKEFKDNTDSWRQYLSTTESTIAAHDYGDGFVQVTPTKVRYIEQSSNEATILTWSPPNRKEIKQAVISDTCIAILSDFNLFICEEIETNPSENTLNFHQEKIIDMQTKKLIQIYKIAVFHDYMFLLQNNNTLHIYSVDTRESLIKFESFKFFPDLIHKDLMTNTTLTQQIVQEMNVIDIGSIPVLTLIMKDGNIILYQFFTATEVYDFALKRIKTRRFTFFPRNHKYSNITQFTNINGKTGGFISGDYPMFLLSENGYPRLIPAPFGLFFTQFDSNFIFGNSQTVRLANFENISTLDTHIIDGCIVQRVPLNRTPRCMTYAQPWNSLVLFVSHPIPFSNENEPDIDEEAKLTPHYQRPPTPPREIQGPKEMYPIEYEEQYELYVVNDAGVSSELTLERHEVGYCVSFIHTSDNYQLPKSNLSEYLAIGTGFMCHEERMVRGRLAIYKGSIVQSETQDVNVYKLQELFNKILPAPVTNLCEVDGYIGAFVGSQLQMIMFINEQNYKVASFLNGHFFANQLISIKNYLLYIDAYKGFQLIRWRKYGNKLITMAKDFQTFTPLSASLIINEGVFGGSIYDCAGNCQIFEVDEYAIPIDAFVIRSVFHIGCRAIASGQFPIRKHNDTTQNEIAGYFGWFASDTGKIGIFAPIKSDKDRRKLCVLQNSYEKTLEGFSHQEYRWGKFSLLKNDELISASPRLIFDMDFILDLLDSPPELQKQCTKSICLSNTEISPIISEIYSTTNIFE